MTAAEDPPAPADELDVDHLADLANLPLSEDEREEAADACRELLEAFALEEVEDPGEERPAERAFPDEAEPWPADEVEAILEAFPERDGRLLRP